MVLGGGGLTHVNIFLGNVSNISMVILGVGLLAVEGYRPTDLSLSQATRQKFEERALATTFATLDHTTHSCKIAYLGHQEGGSSLREEGKRTHPSERLS
mgnify:FL=1